MRSVSINQNTRLKNIKIDTEINVSSVNVSINHPTNNNLRIIINIVDADNEQLDERNDKNKIETTIEYKRKTMVEKEISSSSSKVVEDQDQNENDTDTDNESKEKEKEKENENDPMEIE